MKKIFLLVGLMLSMLSFASSEVEGVPVSVDKCEGILELRFFPVRGVQDFENRYFLKFLHSGNCQKMTVRVGEDTQSLDLRKGTALLFSNKTMNAFLNNDDVTIDFFSSDDKGPIHTYIVVGDQLEPRE